MKVGSLFAGIGGFDLGFERAGMQTTWQVEQDPYCLAVLAKHFPDAQRFEDVCDVGAHNLEPVDLICGGFPCQDLSGAGKGAGLDGERSGLWSEFARIIRELRPRYVVVENVPDLLAGRGKRWPVAPVSRVLGDLSESGYDAEWSVLSAAEFGAPHLRERVWIVAYPRSDGRDLGSGGPQRHEGATRPGAGNARQLGSVGGGDAGRGSRAPHGAVGAARHEALDLADASRDAEARAEAQAGAERERAGQGSASSGEGDLPHADGCRCAAKQQDLRSGESNPARGNRANGSTGQPVPDPDSIGCSEGLQLGSGQSERSGNVVGGCQLKVASNADQLGRQGGAGQLREGRRGESEDGGWWAVEPDVGRVAHGVPSRVDRLSALGNALVPQIAEWIGGRILEFEEGGIEV